MLERSTSRSSRSITPILPPLTTSSSRQRSSLTSLPIQQSSSQSSSTFQHRSLPSTRPSSSGATLSKTIKQQQHNDPYHNHHINNETLNDDIIQFNHSNHIDHDYPSLDTTLLATLDESIERSLQQTSQLSNSLEDKIVSSDTIDTIHSRSLSSLSITSNPSINRSLSFQQLSDVIALRLSNDWHCQSPFNDDTNQASINSTLECLQLLTQLLDIDESNASILLSQHPYVERLSILLHQSLCQSNGMRSKQARNQLVVLIGRLVQYDHARSAFVFTNVINDLIEHSMFKPTELDDVSSVTRFTQTSDAADIELRHIIWTILADISNDWIASSIIAQSDLIDCLLCFIDAAAQCNEVESIKRHISPDINQLSHQIAYHFPFSTLLDLQSTALLAITSLAEHSYLLLQQTSNKSSNDHSLVRLCRFIDHIEFNPLNRKDKQLASMQCRQLKQAAINSVTHVAASLYAEPPHPSIKSNFPQPNNNINETKLLQAGFSSVFRTLTAIVSEPFEQTAATTNLHLASIESRCLALMALTLLCQDDANNRAIARDQRTVHSVSQLVNQCGQQSSTVSPSPSFVFEVVDHLIRVILPDKVSCEIFHAFDGVAGLMQLLSLSLHAATLSSMQQTTEWKLVQVHAVRALIILLQSSSSTSIYQSIMSWRSQPELQSVFRLFIRLWKFQHKLDNEERANILAMRYNICNFLALLEIDRVVQTVSNVLEPEQLILLIEMAAWNDSQSLHEWTTFKEHTAQAVDIEPHDENRLAQQINYYSTATTQFAELSEACNDHVSAVSTASLTAYLGTVNERRIEQQSSIIEKLSTGGFHTKHAGIGKKQNKQYVSPVTSEELRSRPTTTIKKYNSSVYGKFRKVEPFVVDETKEENDA